MQLSLPPCTMLLGHCLMIFAQLGTDICAPVACTERFCAAPTDFIICSKKSIK
ncbi:hypothetical protein XENTR_v10011986 [Xenopus tropicalis]|nr:hypothetical protein XENTR_v10011986 [Xenopus tropicalis]KAE8610010.1 hypothetical protein XENTR_v10011986 [Xenopus tropicalis]